VGLTELQVVEDMHERKKAMAELADGFIALPGGAGTLAEIFEQWTWFQLGIHAKPCGLLNVDGYFDPQIAMIERMVAEGFLSHAYAAMLQVETRPNVLFARMRAYRPPASKWSGKNDLTSPARTIPIAAAVITNDDGRVLLVRKHRTSFFMQPGGKLTAGETALDALQRELEEELGCLLVSSQFLGFFAAPAANEPMHSVEAALFQVVVSGRLEPQAEIEEIVWVDPAATSGLHLAPLTRATFFPCFSCVARTRMSYRRSCLDCGNRTNPGEEITQGGRNDLFRFLLHSPVSY
jgi:8-oxo-dGTP pyrophosphatase MutT (NUDIX family)